MEWNGLEYRKVEVGQVGLGWSNAVQPWCKNVVAVAITVTISARGNGKNSVIAECVVIITQDNFGILHIIIELKIYKKKVLSI